MSGILQGMRVLDWTMAGAGPIAGRILGDLGADVIKIEERLSGDSFRWVEKLAGLVPVMGPRGMSLGFEYYNRNKRGITIDLKKEEGREIVYRLVASSDVFLSNFREKACCELGMDYQTLSRYNRRLIYAHSSGYGRQGPERNSPAYDFAAMARAGLMLNQRSPDTEDGPFSAFGLGDQSTATLTAFAIVAALLARERTGRGQEIHTSLLGSLIWLQGMNLSIALLTGKEYPAHKRKEAGNPLMNSYRAGDGKWLILAMGSLVEKFWPGFCRAIDREDLREDPRFATRDDRERNRRELIEILDGVFAQRPRDAWVRLLAEADCVVSPVNRLSDLAEDPQVLENEYITDYDHPVLGRIKMIGNLIEFSDTPLEITRPAPELGQHTEEVLLEFNYTWDDLQRLRDEEVI